MSRQVAGPRGAQARGVERLHLRAPRPKRATIVMPGDKSISHRAFLFSALADGATRIVNPNAGADVKATMHALEELGVQIRSEGDRIIVQGARTFATLKHAIDCGNSGTTMRLLAGLAAGRASVVLDGDASLRRRPMERVAGPLRALGAQVHCARNGLPPVRVENTGPIAGGHVRLAVPSAQVESTLLLAAMGARGPTTIVSTWSTRDHSRKMLKDFGGRFRVRGAQLTVLPGKLRSPGRISVPGDLSAAVFFIGAAALLPGAQLTIRGVGINPTRARITTILRSMGVDLTIERRHRLGSESVADLRVRAGRPLRPVVVQRTVVPEIIDEIPALCALAAAADGVTVIHGAGELRHKESDRIATTVALLAAFGVRARVRGDTIAVHGGSIRAPKSVRSQGDHRIAMAATILAAAARAPLTIIDSACIETSFPEFARVWGAAF